MGIGLTFEEYVDLRLRPLAGADPVFSDAAERERERMFPMNATGASGHLRSRGYDCRPQMLDLLVEDGVVKPAKPDAWTQADVDAAAEHVSRDHGGDGHPGRGALGELSPRQLLASVVHQSLSTRVGRDVSSFGHGGCHRRLASASAAPQSTRP